MISRLLQDEGSSDEDDGAPGHRYPLRDRGRQATQATPPKEQEQNRLRCVRHYRNMPARSVEYASLTWSRNSYERHALLVTICSAKAYFGMM